MIHAAKRKVDPQGMINFQRAMGNDSDLVPEPVNLFDGLFNEDFPRGCVVAIADLNNCQEMCHEKWAKIYGITDQIKNKANHPKILIEDQTSQERCLGNWLQGRYAWKLENIQSVRPIPVKGKQGLWIPSAELIQKVEEAIKSRGGDHTMNHFDVPQTRIEELTIACQKKGVAVVCDRLTFDNGLSLYQLKLDKKKIGLWSDHETEHILRQLLHPTNPPKWFSLRGIDLDKLQRTTIAGQK